MMSAFASTPASCELVRSILSSVVFRRVCPISWHNFQDCPNRNEDRRQAAPSLADLQGIRLALRVTPSPTVLPLRISQIEEKPVRHVQIIGEDELARPIKTAITSCILDAPPST